MMKSCGKYFLLFIFAFILTLAADMACAAALSEIREELAGYQTDPLARAAQLTRDLSRVRGVENGLARQYDIPASEVLAYEYELEKIINCCYSIYFLQKRTDSDSNFILDDNRMRELAEAKAPYSFIFYLDVIEDIANCRRSLAALNDMIASSRENLQRISAHKNDVESEYRLCREKSSLSTENRLRYNFELMLIRARLELCYAEYTFYEISLKSAAQQSSELQEKLEALEPVLQNVRANIDFTGDGYNMLDSEVYSRVRQLQSTITMLNYKFDELDEQRRRAERQTDFARYWIPTEQKLVEDETLLVLDLVELWGATRLTWRVMDDLFSGRLSLKERRNLLSDTRGVVGQCRHNLKYANDALQYLRYVNQEAARRFGNGSSLRTEEERRMLADFLTNIEARKNRYLSYLIMLGEMSSQFEILLAETERVIGEANTDDKIESLWRDNVGGIMNMEIWSIDDYPITVKKLALALAIFLFGMLVTHYAVLLTKKHFEASGHVSRHSALLIQNIVFYLGLVISFLITLWMLHIPLTAFAFMGGAAAIAIGLGTQKIMGDTLSGILLLFQKKLRIGDEVVIGDTHGIVVEITLQNTVLVCQQSRHLIIPNSKVLDSPVLNLTLNNSLSRTEVNVSIAYDSDVNQAMSLIRAVLSENPHVLKTPPFRIILSEFEDSAIKFTAYFFIDLSKVFESNVQSAVRVSILDAFREHGIEIPFPQTEVRMKDK
ncbi:MAG: mechanosensitive ion channel [Synergistaceae bacterium]|nr:mechanosensitive ion channel [Synergistaceae bacterium]